MALLAPSVADHWPAPATGGAQRPVGPPPGAAQRPEGASGGMRAAAHTYHAAAGNGGGDERRRAGGGDERRRAGERAQAVPRPVFKGGGVPPDGPAVSDPLSPFEPAGRLPPDHAAVGLTYHQMKRR